MTMRWRLPGTIRDFIGRARERQAAFLLDGFPDRIAVLDGDGAIILVNRAWRDFARANGLTDPRDGVGLGYLAVCDRAAAEGDAHAAEAAAGIRAVLGGRQTSFHMTYPGGTPEEPRWFGMYVVAVKGRGRGRAIVRHADATALVRAAAEQERARAAAEDAEDANKDKSRFLAMASHDLRQPMMALRLFLEVLSRRATDPGLRPVLDKANETLAALTDLFESLLDLSQLETGQRSVQAMPVRLDDLQTRLGDEFGIVARAKGLRFRVVLCRLTVYGDPILLERILRNLLSNAIRYTERGGVLMGCRRVGDRVRIDVVDTGIGIPLEQQALIFRESYRIESRPEGAKTGRERGFGLGLAIVQRAAALMHAPVDVSSRLGRGSRFSVTVPTSSRPAPAEPAPHAGERTNAPPGRSADRCLVLVIENDEMVALALRLFLEEFGCVVLTAETLAEAEAVLDASPAHPDFIIANHYLPGDRPPGGRDGIEAIRRLRAAMGEEVPAWIITGDWSAEIEAAARSSRIGCLRKPVRPADIQAGILAALSADRPSVQPRRRRPGGADALRHGPARRA